MKTLLLPFNSVGWEEKKNFFEQILASRCRPPFMFNDILILVPSARLKRVFSRFFLDTVERLTGARALVQPEILTFHQFLQHNFLRLAGPKLIDENSRLVLLEGLVKDRLQGSPLFDQSPDLLAPSLSAALAKMIEQLAAAMIGPGELADRIKDSEFIEKPQVRLLIDIYGRYREALWEAGLVDPAGMRSYLCDHFDPAWTGNYKSIIIDSVQPRDRIDIEILTKLAAASPCTFFIEAPSRELLVHAEEFHPLRIVKEFMSSAGIETGEEKISQGPDDRYLASALFSNRSFAELTKAAPAPAAFSKKIDLLSAVNIREEVTLIAASVKKSLQAGTPSDSVLVAFPNLDDYGPIVEEIFNDYGIPFNRALGRQLSSSAVAASIISLLRAFQEEYSGPSLLRVFSSPFLKFRENPATVPALDRLMRDRRITGGMHRLLSVLPRYRPDEQGKDALTAPLNDLFSALTPFSAQETASLAEWMNLLKGLIAWSGMEARVSHLKGPLNINLQAYKKLSETLASLDRAGKIFPAYRYTFPEWFFLLKKTFMHTRFQVPPEDEGGVQILGFEESLSRPWNEIYLGGLVDGKFPQRLPQNIFLPEKTLESLGVRTLERARLAASYHFYRLLLSADRVLLTWPENEGDRPVVPSPFLEELRPLIQAGLLNRGFARTSGVQFSLRIEDSRSMTELAKSAALAPDERQLDDVLKLDLKGMAGIRTAMHFTQGAAPETMPHSANRRFSVTELESYLRCPYDYYISNVLGLSPVEDVTEDLSPLDRGSKVHAILRNFYLSWDRPVTRDNASDAAALLQELSDDAFAPEADTFRNRRTKLLFRSVIAKRFLDAEVLFWQQGMKPAYLERKIEGFFLPLAGDRSVELSGKIDRIDVDQEGNFMIVDYKTGAYPLPGKKLEEKIFQLPVYAVIAQETLRNGTPPLRKPIGLVYYDLAGKHAAAARDVVVYNKDVSNGHTSSKPKASPKSGEEFELFLRESMDRARKAVEGILAGRFPALPQEESTCRFCPNEAMCEKEE